METILQARGLKKYYGKGETQVRALDGVDLDIERGKFTAIIGTSGSGKATLLNMLGGLDTPTEGSIRVGDTELAKLNSEQATIFRRKQIGFIFQNYNLVAGAQRVGKHHFPHLTGWPQAGQKIHHGDCEAAGAGEEARQPAG